MSFNLLVTATDLQSKAELLGTRYKLPHLVRRLIQRSDPTAKQPDFRTAEGTQLGGWDGVIQDAIGNDYVPAGCSVWELGVDRAIKGKADKDYTLRTTDPLGIDPQETTYVFVTPRRWSTKHKWATEKQARGEWKAVRAYDADDLAAWLETAPGVHIWLSHELGKYPGAVSDLQTWWDDWATLTNPVLTPALLLAGRDETVTKIMHWFRSEEATLALQAGTRAEAVAAIAATALGMDDMERLNYLNQAVVVQTEATWQELIAREQGLILIPEFDSANVLGAATRRQHRVLLPLDVASVPTADVILLAPNQWEPMREALLAAGIQQPEADELAHLARRSFSAFRRKWLTNPAANALSWAHPAAGASLLPALLAGAWEDQHPGDRAVLEHVAGISYERYQEALTTWMHSPEAPVRQVAGTWFVVDKADAWEQLQRLLSSDMFRRYEAEALKVLSEPDPKFTLPDDEQRWARTRGMARAHSARLRRGMADTLALLGATGEITRPVATLMVRARVAQLLTALFELANADQLGHIWASFGSDVRLLAEADPATFLRFVTDDLNQPSPVLLTLFHEREGLFHRSSEHTGLLWALEALAWNPDYLAAATLALAQLARLDPGGQVSNRPANSLRQIFLLWHPQTTADLDERIKSLKQLQAAEPAVAWSLLVRLLPQAHDTSFPTVMPQWRWRDWQVSQRSGIPRKEYFDGVSAVTDLILMTVGTDANRWAHLFPEFGQWLPAVSPEEEEKILTRAEQLSTAQFTDEEMALLRDKLGSLLSLHRSVTADWVLSTQILDRLDRLYQTLTPKGLALRYGWVFARWPQLPTKSNRRDHEGRTREVYAAQDVTIQTIYEAKGLAGLLELVPQVPEAFQLGQALGRSPWASEHEAELLTLHLAAPEPAWQNFAEGLAYAHVLRSRDEAEGFVRAQSQHWRATQTARYLAYLPADKRTWQLAQELGEEVQRAYWEWVLPYGIKTEDYEEAVRQFIACGRYTSAIEVLDLLTSDDARLPSPDLVVEALEKLAEFGAENDRSGRTQSYILQHLLDRLDDEPEIERNRLVGLAFAYQPFFGLSENPKILDRELAANPSFFVKLLCLVYRDKNADQEKTEPLAKDGAAAGQWERAWHVLREWHTIPGTQADRRINATELRAWIEAARTLAQEAGRLTSCDSVLGELLSHAPQEPLPEAADQPAAEATVGPWPPVAVQQVIEEIHTQELLNGLRTGRFNIHGRTHAVTGGHREQTIADNYQQWAIHYRHAPHTAQLLRDLAERFKQMAQSEREEADLREQTEQ